MDEEAAFEVFEPATGRRMKVYASGRIEGFPPGYSAIINRIPLLTNRCVAEALDAKRAERGIADLR